MGGGRGSTPESSLGGRHGHAPLFLSSSSGHGDGALPAPPPHGRATTTHRPCYNRWSAVLQPTTGFVARGDGEFVAATTVLGFAATGTEKVTTGDRICYNQATMRVAGDDSAMFSLQRATKKATTGSRICYNHPRRCHNRCGVGDSFAATVSLFARTSNGNCYIHLRRGDVLEPPSYIAGAGVRPHR